ncbi:response regulator transcription factor [Paenibacillus sp. strain BS8-2]
MIYRPMLTVLIVDDEEPLRKEMSSYPWEDWGAELIGEARNGEEALAFCEQCEPDLVITDVTMPAMDGITLLRELRRRFPRMQVVLQTVHSDFAYAREAIRQEALDYLVKSNVEEEDLKRVLRKTEQAINQASLVVRSAKEERRWHCGKEMYALLHDTPAQEMDEGWRKFAERYDIMPEGPAALIQFKLISLPMDELYASRTVQDALHNWELDKADPLRWISLKSREYVVFAPFKQREALITETVQLMKQVQQHLSASFSYSDGEIDLIAVISAPFETGGELKLRFAENQAWEDARFYAPEPTSVYYGAPSLLRSATPEESAAVLNSFSLAASDYTRCKQEIQEVFIEWASQEAILPGELKELALRGVLRWPIDDTAEPERTLNRTLLEQASALTELSELLHRQLDMLYSSHPRKLRGEVAKAKQIIEEQYAEPFTLQNIAEQVGQLSAAYLGKLFREELGESFNEYVSKVRVQKAMQLLKAGDTKVYEIAEAVGIPNYRYFSLVFRKYTGFAPSDYKKNDHERNGRT